MNPIQAIQGLFEAATNTNPKVSSAAVKGFHSKYVVAGKFRPVALFMVSLGSIGYFIKYRGQLRAPSPPPSKLHACNAVRASLTHVVVVIAGHDKNCKYH